MTMNTGRVIAVTLTCVLAHFTTAQAQDDTYPNEVDTHIGKLMFDHGIPTEETSKKLYYELDYHRAVLKRGAFVEYDCFGREYYTDELGGLSWGHDSWRVEAIATLVSEGYVEQLVLSQDVALKMDLCRYGGNGYGHILRTIVPWLRRDGVTDDALVTMLVENPRRILTIDWDNELFTTA